MPTFRSSTNSINALSSTVTLNKPSGTSDGDYLLAGISVGGGATITVVPSGWTQDYSGSPGGSKTFYVYKKLASGEPASWTWTASSSSGSLGIAVAVQDLDQVSPLNISGGQTNASSVNVVAPSITTTVNSCLLVGFFYTNAGTTFTPPGSTTEIDDIATGTNGMEAVWQLLGASGATGTRTAVAGSAAVNAGWIGAIAPSAQANKMLFRFATMG